jgi:mRNA-degrading endonuclease RelE of RelBE toxin-antitoxin system
MIWQRRELSKIKMLNTVVEFPAYTDIAEQCFSEEERQAIINFLAKNPESGDVIPATGGLRKLRWRKDHKGKRGGVRIIYYFHDRRIPLFLLIMYAKEKKSDLTIKQQQTLASLMKTLTATMLGKNDGR